MKASILAHAMLLHAAVSSAESMQAMLPAELRDEVQAEMARIAEWPQAQLWESLHAMRRAEADAAVQQWEQQTGRSLEHASPRLVAWLTRPF